jgi:hypothetical protein
MVETVTEVAETVIDVVGVVAVTVTVVLKGVIPRQLQALRYAAALWHPGA